VLKNGLAVIGVSAPQRMDREALGLIVGRTTRQPMASAAGIDI
jgi:hypothetical protein